MHGDRHTQANTDTERETDRHTDSRRESARDWSMYDDVNNDGGMTGPCSEAERDERSCEAVQCFALDNDTRLMTVV